MQHPERMDILRTERVDNIFSAIPEQFPSDLIDDDGIMEPWGHTGSNGLTNGNEIIDIIPASQDRSTRNSKNASDPSWWKQLKQRWNDHQHGIHNPLGTSPVEISNLHATLVSLGYSHWGRTKLTASLIILVILFSSIIIMVDRSSSRSILIDGEFHDWKRRVMITTPDTDPENRISACSMDVDGVFLSLYLETKGSQFIGFGSSPDILRIFIDSDATTATGYHVGTIGADVLVEIVGNNKHIESSEYYSYDQHYRTITPRGNADWNAWSRMYSVDSAVSGEQLELQLWRDELPCHFQHRLPKAMFHLTRASGEEDISPVISPAGGALVSTRSLITSETIEANSKIPIFSLQIRDIGGGGVNINSISFLLYSSLNDEEIASSELTSDASAARFHASIGGGRLFFTTEEDLTDSVVSEWRYTLSITLTCTVTLGHALIMGLSNVDSPAGITIADHELARAYAVDLPKTPIIDGLFSEWSDTVETTSESDISISLPQSNPVGTFLHARCSFDPLTGMIIPVTHPIMIPSSRSRASPPPDIVYSTQAVSMLPVSSNTDSLLLFLSSGDTTGYELRPGVRSDHYVELQGSGNHIVSSRLLTFTGKSGTDWNWTDLGDIRASLIGGELEFHVTLSNAEIVQVHSTAGGSERRWSLEVGKNNSILMPTVHGIRSGGTDVCVNEVFPNPISESDEWVELFNPGSDEIDLEEWALVDEAGIVWSGSANDAISGHGTYLIQLNNKLRNSGEKLILYDRSGTELDNLTYPTYSSYEGLSHARISDGSEFFERDSTPTKGMNNNISADIVVNEILYDVTGSEPDGEFIELYNTGSTEADISNWTIRNDDRTPFVLDRILGSSNFTSIDSNSTDRNEYSYTDCFGTYGLAGSEDFVVLENSLGQVVDRITYASSASSDYFDSSGVEVAFDTSAPDVDEGNTLGRYPDGADSNDDSEDFLECTPSQGEANLGLSEFSSIILMVICIPLMIGLRKHLKKDVA